MTDHATSVDARHLKTLSQILDKPLLHSFVISNDTETHSFADGITAIHAGLLLG